jgi:hypothetical protein
MNLKNPLAIDWAPLDEAALHELERLDVSVDLYTYFRDSWVGNPFDFNVRRVPSGESARSTPWQHISSRHLRNEDLIKHLAGAQWLATGCKRGDQKGSYVTDRFSVDLDATDGMWDRYDRLVDTFGLPILFRSSASGGLRADYILDRYVETRDILDPETGRGVVADLLESAGVPIVAGRVELFPIRPYFGPDGRRRAGRPLRLPFGAESLLFDAEERVPISRDGLHALRKVRSIVSGGFVAPIDYDELVGDARTARRGKTSRRVAKRPNASGSYRPAELIKLDRDGLERYGQFNDAVFAKSIDYAIQLVPFDDARLDLIEWLDAKHNNQSRTYNRDPNAARAEAGEVLEWVYANWIEYPRWAPRPGLTEFEVATIQAIVGSDKRGEVVDRSTGELIPRFKAEQFLFRLIDGMKQWTLTRAIRTANKVRATHPAIAIGSPEFEAAFTDACRYFWPRPPVPLFVVDCPYVFRRGIPGVSEQMLPSLWQFAKTSGLLKLHRRAHPDSGKCESYAVLLDFGAIDGSTYRALPAALLSGLNSRDQRERYSTHYLNRIRQDGLASLASELGSESSVVEQFVRWRLAGRCHACAKQAIDPNSNPGG